MPLDQHASHYFASHFIMLPGAAGQRGVPRRGHLDYLVPFLRTETDPRGPFQLAYSACGLAALSNRERSAAGGADLTALSFVQHTRAMRAIGAALRDPERCKTDATLAAVQLLCFFEVSLWMVEARQAHEQGEGGIYGCSWCQEESTVANGNVLHRKSRRRRRRV